MLQQEKPIDYVIATGKKYTVRAFIEQAFRNCGIELEWQGKDVNEVGIIKTIASSSLNESYIHQAQLKEGQTVLRIDPYYFRPTEVNCLIGDASKAKKNLGWTPKTTFEELVKEMIESDLKLAYQELILKNNKL